MFKVNSFAGAGRSEPKDCGLKQLVYKFIDIFSYVFIYNVFSNIIFQNRSKGRIILILLDFYMINYIVTELRNYGKSEKIYRKNYIYKFR